MQFSVECESLYTESEGNVQSGAAALNPASAPRVSASYATESCILDFTKRLIEVANDVFNVFDADRNAHQAVRDA